MQLKWNTQTIHRSFVDKGGLVLLRQEHVREQIYKQWWALQGERGGASGSNAHEDGELCCHPTFVEGSVVKLWKRIRLEAVPLSSTPLS